MRKLVLIAAAMVFTMFVSGSLSACEICQEHFVWPQIEECWFCDPSHCAAEVCELSGDDVCAETGTGCWDGVGNCNDVWWERNGVLVNPMPSLNSTWRLASVRVTRSRQITNPPTALKKG